jgi:hypothetical protein
VAKPPMPKPALLPSPNPGRRRNGTAVTDVAPLDLAAVRARFPALSRTGEDGLPVIHADAPGGTQVVADVIEAMSAYLRHSNANSHGTFATSAETDALVDGVRGDVGDFLGTEPEGVVFGPNMTTLTWHFSRTLDDRIGVGDEIVCTQLDHDANVSPWLALAERTGATIRWVHLDPDTGRLDLSTLEVGPRLAWWPFLPRPMPWEPWWTPRHSSPPPRPWAQPRSVTPSTPRRMCRWIAGRWASMSWRARRTSSSVPTPAC